MGFEEHGTTDPICEQLVVNLLLYSFLIIILFY